MKKLKLLTSLSTLALSSTIVPIVSTSCSEEFSFDGEYDQRDVLGQSFIPCDEWYENEWINKNLKYNDKDWSVPADPEMNESYNDPKAIAYLNSNFKSVRQFIGFMIYSIMLKYVESGQSETEEYLQVKISDSVFDYDSTTKRFTMQFTLSYFDQEENTYIPSYRVRTKKGESLKLLRVCKYTEKINSFVIGSTYEFNEKFLNFGLEISTYNTNISEFEEWQDLNTMNIQTKDYVTSLTAFYFPSSLCETAQFKQSNIQIWIFDNNEDSLAPITKRYYEPNETITFDKKWCDGSKLFLYPLVLNVNGIITLMSEYYYDISFEVEDPGSSAADICVDFSMLGVIPLAELIGSEITITINVKLTFREDISSSFKLAGKE